MADEKKETGGEEAGVSSSVPEVEAEVVKDDAAEKSSAGFDDGEREAAPSPDETTAAPAGRAGRSAFTPGVILFLAFAAAALIAFALWRLQGGGAPSAETAGPAEAGEPAPTEPPADKAPDESAAAVTPDDSADAPADPETPASKIANDAAAEAKQTRDIDPVVDVPTADDAYLPPLPGEDAGRGNRALQEAAKEAARRFGPEAEEAPAEEPASDAIDGFEFDGGADAPDSSSSAAPAGSTTAADKIDNADLAALKEAFRAETQRLAGALTEERERTAALREEITAMRRDFEAALAAREAHMDAEIADLRAEIDKIQNGGDLTASRRAAGAVALNSLEAAVERGRPFASELDTLQRIAPDETQIAALRLYADDGAPRREALKESFPAAARAGLAAAGQEKAGEGFFARLGARAQSLVSVRPAEPQTGAGPRAVISRAEAAVEQGDLAAALEEIETLPARARNAMADWTEKARARAEVDRALAALKTRFLTPTGEG